MYSLNYVTTIITYHPGGVQHPNMVVNTLGKVHCNSQLETNDQKSLLNFLLSKKLNPGH